MKARLVFIHALSRCMPVRVKVLAQSIFLSPVKGHRYPYFLARHRAYSAILVQTRDTSGSLWF